jgi:membrane-associated protein
MIDFVLHIDKHLAKITADYQGGVYLILFGIIFAETGLVVTPFLPGDSLLFAAGALAALGQMQIALLLFVLALAAILGNTTNYFIGRFFGERLLKNSKIIKPSALQKTEAFYDKYGAKTIVFTRFVPIVRTFAPFVAGMGKMNFGTFMTYNVLGGLFWVGLCTLAGYFFGNIGFVKKNFSVVVLAIILLSVLPMIVEILKHKREQKAASQTTAA